MVGSARRGVVSTSRVADTKQTRTSERKTVGSRRRMKDIINTHVADDKDRMDF